MIVYTLHARLVMAERGVEPEWVERTLAAPEEDEPDLADADLRRAFRAIPERDHRVLRVVYSKNAETFRVITAFFDRGRRR